MANRYEVLISRTRDEILVYHIYDYTKRITTSHKPKTRKQAYELCDQLNMAHSDEMAYLGRHGL